MTAKTVQIALVSALALFSVNGAYGRTRISVTAFENKAGGDCYYSHYQDLGSGMADQLITKLSEMDRYEVLEREHLEKAYRQEHELINQDETTAPEKGKFRAAQVTVAGAITSFEYCAGGGGAGVNVGRWIGIGDMRVGGRKEHAKVVIDMRVIDVRTGKVLRSVKAEGKAHRVKAEVEGVIKDVDFGTDAFYRTPLGEATRKAIADAAEQVAKSIPEMPDTSTEVSKKTDKPKSTSESTRAHYSSGKVLCKKDDRTCREVKVLETSSKGGNARVYNLSDKETTWAALKDIHELLPIESLDDVKDGENLLASIRGTEARYYRCTVLDKASDAVIADCPSYSSDPESLTADRLYRIAKK